MMFRGKRNRILEIEFFFCGRYGPCERKSFFLALKFQSAIGIAPGSFVKFWGKLLN